MKKLINQTILRLLIVILMTAGLFGGISRAFALSGSGTQSNPYKITSDEDWRNFCRVVNGLANGGNESAWAELLADIYVTVSSSTDIYEKMVGRPVPRNMNNNENYSNCRDCYFKGNFDGHGHTLNFTFNYNLKTRENAEMDSYVGKHIAPFSRVSGGTIKNLKVSGTITIPNRNVDNNENQYKFAAGIAGYASYSTVIQNCISNITIDSRINGDGSHGGIVGVVYNRNTTIKDCLFTGKLLGSSTTNCAGFVGSGSYGSNPNCIISNCLFDPQEITMSTEGSATYSRCAGTVTNSYYKTSFGATNGQGANASTMSAVDLVAGLNTGATSGNESWVMHNNQYLLKPFEHYVDITGWVSGFSANAPEIKGFYSTNSIIFAYYSDDGVTSLGYDPPTAPGHYRVSATVAPGSTADGDYWYGWNDYMKFCVVSAPTGATLTYNYNTQTLLTNGGSAAVGTFYYKLGADGEWSTSFPTATKAGDYKVYYYVKGDAYHNDIISDSYFVPVTIAPKTVNTETGNIKIEVPATVTYTGSALTPAVTVKDGDTVIDPSEYSVSYSTNNVNVTTDTPVTVTITDKTGGNYDVSGTTTFTIVKAEPTYTAPVAKDLYYNMNVQALITAGSTSHGTFEYSTDGTNFVTATTGLVGTEAKDYLIYYRIIGDANHSDVGNVPNPPLTLTATIKPKPVSSPEILISPDVYNYDGTAKQPTVTVRDGGTVIPTSEYTVEYQDNVNAGSAKVVIKDNPKGNYDISGSASFTIIAQQPGVTPPTPISGLIYNAKQQNLIMVGTAVGGTMEYSLDGTNFSTAIPKGQDAKQYAVYYRVKGDDNHEDREAVTIYATISPKTVSAPLISLSSSSLVYDGNEKKPDVTVKDGQTVIPASEYTVEYSNNVDVGTGMVIIMDKNGGNYIVNGSTTFQIISADAGITPPTPKADLVYTGSAQVLINEGKAEGGTMEYSLDRTNYSTEAPTGTDAKEYKVYYRVKGDANHGDETATSLSVTISPKVLSQAEIILDPANFIYDGTEKQPAVTVKDGDLKVPASEYTVKYSNNQKVGTGTVTLVDNDGGNYTVSGTANFAIISAVAGVTLPTAKADLVYNGAAQELITAGSAVGGTMEYSLDNKKYSTKVPTGTDAKQYNVYVRVIGDDGHDSMDPVSMIVKISSKTVSNPVMELSPVTNVYTGKEVTPTVILKDGDTGAVIPASEYTVSYSNNINIGTANIAIKDNPGGNYTVSLTTTFIIYDPNIGFQAPKPISGMVYNGKAQNLVIAGTATEGDLQYSLDGKTYSTTVPVGTNAATYTVWYRVLNPKGEVKLGPESFTVTISPKTVLISVSLTGLSTQSIPVLTVVDDQDNALMKDDYTVTYKTPQGKEVTPTNGQLPEGDYEIIVKPTGNYSGPSISTTFHVRGALSFVFTIQSDLVTVCLPFGRAVPAGYDVYYFDRVEDDGTPLFKRILLQQLKAGEPYILYYTGSSAGTRAWRQLDLSPSNPALVDLSTPIVQMMFGDYVFSGIYDDMTNQKGVAEGAYILQADNTWQATASSKQADASKVYLEAFHAYLRHRDRSTDSPTINVKMSPSTTAIGGIILEDEDGEQTWYDLNGRRIDGPQRGVNILRTKSGQTRKVVIR